MIVCVEGCDKCCKGVCECCEGAAKAVGSCFSRPFSFCVFLTFVVMVLPAIGGVYYFSMAEGDCDPDTPLHLLI